METAADRLVGIARAIERAATIARRRADDVTLVAVTKGHLVEDIAPLIAAGQRVFAESRVQEALDKWPALLAANPGVTLHCIGRLQTNKAADAVQLFDVIQSLDRPVLLEALSTAAAKAGRFPSVYVQVDVGEEEQKGGCAIDDLADLLAAVRQSPFPLAGLMCIPPLDRDPAPYFALLADLALRHGVTGLSMGMSGDYETAVMLGATVVRVGTALFED